MKLFGKKQTLSLTRYESESLANAIYTHLDAIKKDCKNDLELKAEAKILKRMLKRMGYK